MGVVLLVIELFIPGFALPGVAGIISLVVGLTLAFNNILLSILVMAVTMIVAIIAFMIFGKLGYKGKFFNRLMLKESLLEKEGFISNNPAKLEVGTVLTATSDLRPSGYVELNFDRYDAYAELGSFIPKGSKVVIQRYEGSKMIVRRA